MGSFDYASGDGTSIRGWRNAAAGGPLSVPPVVISNGLGTSPAGWPVITRADSGFRVATWYHRGTGGSARPADPARIAIPDHVDDLRALMDHEGMERALIVGWSLGVNVAFEFAREFPERAAGILAVAGVPGGTFDSMWGPIPVPRRLRGRAGVATSRGLRRSALLLRGAARVMPVHAAAELIRHSGAMLPAAKHGVVVDALADFRTHDWKWYFTLAEAAASHTAMDLSFVRCPTTLVAGRWDIVTSWRDVVRAAQQIPHAEIRVMRGSHFLPLERPAELAELLSELAARADI